MLLFGIFVDGALRCREQIHFTVPGAAPRTLAPESPLVARLALPRAYQSVAILCVALEEDSGQAVRSMYAALERPLRTWRPGDAMPEPHDIGASEWPRAVPQPVELLLEGRDFRDVLRGDDVIAAVLVELAPTLSDYDLRFELRSPDGKNEWTARARVSLRGS